MPVPDPIEAGDRVFCPEQPEHGYGQVKLVEENILSDERICQVAFEWVPGLTTIPESAVQRLPKLEAGLRITEGEWGSVGELQRRLGAALVMAENSQTASFIRSFTMPLPHQAFLLEKIVAHRRFGHVIADDVGMGKTVEAGLIIATLRQRNPRMRVLVLSPAGIVLQWQDEMEEHFGLDFSIAGRDFSAKRGTNWNSHPLVLASLDMLKQERHRDVLKGAPPFDLVICDEAHKLTVRREFMSEDLYRTQNYKFVKWLVDERLVEWETNGDGSPRSPRLLMLTATPHQGDNLRFAYLLELARPDRIEAEGAAQPGGALEDVTVIEECLTRTAKRRAVDWSGKSIFIGHETHTLDVELCPAEKAVLDHLARYIENDMVFQSERGNALIRALAMHTFQKIAASSWIALEVSLAARLAHAGGSIPAAVENGGGEEESLGQEFEFLGGADERAALEAILNAVRGLNENTKWEKFAGLTTAGGGFRAKGEKILIFTQYRKTQDWLKEKLTAIGERVTLIHGGMGMDERKAARTEFERAGSIMVSTEAGSEGANMHRQCHLLINYDLPWNPMRLLQRIGRLDRYGQKHRVRVTNLRAPTSWDSVISQKIATKLAAVQKAMGLVVEEDYEAMIVGSVHEAINVAKVMEECLWGRGEAEMDKSVTDAVKSVLERHDSIKQMLNESLGMPENYGSGQPVLGSDAFRQAFAWAAAGHDIMLRETRTSENQFLKGVYHFTLPEAFKGGLRATRECYLVFNRDRFAEVRNESLGQARGQEIKPTLAGFGDPVTDWFFRSALNASTSRAVYSIKRLPGIPDDEVWWAVYAARWKSGSGWTGPDAVFVVGQRDDGSITRSVKLDEAMRSLHIAEQSDEQPQALPDQTELSARCREELRQALGVATDRRHLAMMSLCFVKVM